MDELARIAAAAGSQRAFREAALDHLVPFDIAFFHALNPRVPLETGVFRGVEPEVFVATMTAWDGWAVELGRWRDSALDAGGVAVDVDVFPPRERAKLGWFREVARPLGLTSCALVHLLFAGRLVSAIGLGRRRGGFSPGELDLLRRAAPVLALADVAHGSGVVAPLAEAQRTVVCVDDRLSPRQREIVGFVALGHTNAQIARSLGSSPNTVRNQLVVICRLLGAANRAEVVRLAVLR